MLKNISKLEYSTGNKVYNFLCDNDSPLNEVKDALFQFLKYVGQVEDAAKMMQNQQNPLSQENSSTENENKPEGE